MAFIRIPSIFWETLISLCAILFAATVIGRAWCGIFPYRYRSTARYYLSPAIGLATIVIIACYFGRYIAFDNSVLVPVGIAGLIGLALLREQKMKLALKHASAVSLFGILCGASVLGPLLIFGALNAHNDTFTYLVHSNWLQYHSFANNISPEQITPVTTQVSLYQQEGFRMGASYFLALAQSLLNLKWSYEVYPSVVISAIAACCLSIGFPLNSSLRDMRKLNRLILLSLPAFSLGGIVFGANLGFLPQTFGLAVGGGLIFAMGPIMLWIIKNAKHWSEYVKVSFPCSIFLAAAVFVYSEISPFLIAAIIASGFYLAARYREWKKVVIFLSSWIFISILLLNSEIIRAYNALRTQSGAVVGSPVDWPFIGFVAHAFGVHGGAWDGFQWTRYESSNAIMISIGILLLIISVSILIFERRKIWIGIINNSLMPTVMIISIFGAAMLYFRYFVSTPFTIGKGQSWSQFKLADWSHPFVMALLLYGFANMRHYKEKYFEYFTVTVFVIGLITSVFAGVQRTKPIIGYYGGTRDLNRYYNELRGAVNNICGPNMPIYLSLNGQDHKFRQMAAYYLSDHEVTGDWMDDGYIFPRLPVEKRVQDPCAGQCVIEKSGQGGLLNHGRLIGPFRIGIFEGQGRILISKTSGCYSKETDGTNWWHWVEKRVTFKLKPLSVPKEAEYTKISFVYGTREDQILTLSIKTKDGEKQQLKLNGKANNQKTFEKLFILSPSKISEITIETDGKAKPLGKKDPRIAAWLIRNMKITPISNL